MPRRVILGNKGADTGLWISKPGKDALTSTSDDDFLVNNSRLNTQPVMKGIMQNPTVYYQGTTRRTDIAPVYVCKEYDGYWDYPGGYRYEWVSKWWQADGGDWEWVWYDKNTWKVYCKNGDWSTEQVDSPGVATYSATIPHNLGYIPQSILSATTEYPGNPCPNMFIDENNIYIRYYENDVGYTAGGIVWTAAKPSSMTMFCTVHYTLFAQSA